MPDIVRILFFVFTNVLGHFMVSLVLHGSTALGLITPRDIPENLLAKFEILYLGGTMWAWIAGMVLSLGYFFTNKTLRILWLWMPVLLPLLYASGVLAFFR
ncbi:MAG: hypothetical protein H6862_03580 [Rhodospirillales bacterium]|nr:hypothetical protein [Rhodospirillales bacterium]